MTLNASSNALRSAPRSTTLEGSERGLDALIGLVVLVAELAIGYLAFTALYVWAVKIAPGSQSPELAEAGLTIALFGGGIFVGITTIVYLTRVARGRKSWTAPLW